MDARASLLSDIFIVHSITDVICNSNLVFMAMLSVFRLCYVKKLRARFPRRRIRSRMRSHKRSRIHDLAINIISLLREHVFRFIQLGISRVTTYHTSHVPRARVD